VRIQKIRDLLQDILEPPADKVFWSSDRALADELFRTLSDNAMSTITAMEFNKLSKLACIVDNDYLATEILGREGTAIIETSHGILTDRYHGFHPHTTKLRTIPDVSFNLIRECAYDGLTRLIGVTRAYQIRHGAGPMVTECPKQVEQLLPGSNKEENRWQGCVRVGPLDFVALRYAINVCGGPSVFTGLAVTWFDQIPVFGKWQYCDSYNRAIDPFFFTDTGEINVRRGADENQLLYQKRLGELLRDCRPNVTTYAITPDATRDQLSALCTSVMREHTGISVRMISLGPTEREKVLY
jgi:adenylosuccinate synthase